MVQWGVVDKEQHRALLEVEPQTITRDRTGVEMAITEDNHAIIFSQ